MEWSRVEQPKRVRHLDNRIKTLANIFLHTSQSLSLSFLFFLSFFFPLSLSLSMGLVEVFFFLPVPLLFICPNLFSSKFHSIICYSMFRIICLSFCCLTLFLRSLHFINIYVDFTTNVYPLCIYTFPPLLLLFLLSAI